MVLACRNCTVNRKRVLPEKIRFVPNRVLLTGGNGKNYDGVWGKFLNVLLHSYDVTNSVRIFMILISRGLTIMKLNKYLLSASSRCRFRFCGLQLQLCATTEQAESNSYFTVSITRWQKINTILKVKHQVSELFNKI